MAPLLWLAIAHSVLHLALGQAIQDSRCYLMNGGAVESFFISEDTPIGSIVGTLSVNGDPREVGGDITLRVQESNAAVALVAGSKNLTLRRALDREERLGPSSVYVNVRCDRRHTADPSFVIPVSIRVWDVNDNAPSWRGAPYRARVSELAAVGARVLAAPASDPDQPGPHAAVRYSVLPGPASEYVGFLSELDSTVVVKRPLDYETLRNFTVRLRAQDGGSPPLHNDTTLTVEVLDADDQNPAFQHDHYSALLPEDAQDGTLLALAPAPLHAADRDAGICAPVQYALSGEHAALVRADRDTGALAASAALLDHRLPVTVVVKATQVDNPDRYALTTVTIRGARTAPAPGEGEGVRFLRKSFAVSVPEDAPPGTVLAALHTRARPSAPLQFYVSERSFLERFAINGAGEVLLRRPLDYETTDRYHYQVMVTDGIYNDTASINITVVNVNEWEPRFRHAHYSFALDAAPRGRAARVGQLRVFDGDRQDTVSLHLSGPDARMLEVNDAGEVFVLAEALRALNSSELHVVATAVDSGSPPRQTSVPVVVRVSGALGATGAAHGARGAPVLAAFSAALALLALCVLALAAYLCRLKRKRQIKDKKASNSVAPEKPLGAPLGTGTGGVGGAGGAASGSLLSVSAGASTILDSSSSLERSAELPTSGAARAGGGGGGGGGGGAALMSDHLAGGAGRSGVAWPSATIPARVKKLSWDDALPQGDESRPVTEATNAAVADHMNLTVYF